MADRGLCSVCGGDFAVAQDGTPYKHNNNDEVCPGAEQPISMLQADAVWLVYADEGRFVVLGPRNRNDEHPDTFEASSGRGVTAPLPLVGTVSAPTPEEINPLLPGDLQVPTGEGPQEPVTSDEE